jgi:uncharacterized protein (DUF3820 family)
MSELTLEDSMPFGKYKGRQIEDLMYDEPKYLAWLVENDIVQFEQAALDAFAEKKII